MRKYKVQEHRSQGPDASFGMPRVRPVTPDFITRRSITKANPVHERARLLNDETTGNIITARNSVKSRWQATDHTRDKLIAPLSSINNQAPISSEAPQSSLNSKELVEELSRLHNKRDQTPPTGPYKERIESKHLYCKEGTSKLHLECVSNIPHHDRGEDEGNTFAYYQAFHQKEHALTNSMHADGLPIATRSKERIGHLHPYDYQTNSTFGSVSHKSSASFRSDIDQLPQLSEWSELEQWIRKIEAEIARRGVVIVPTIPQLCLPIGSVTWVWFTTLELNVKASVMLKCGGWKLLQNLMKSEAAISDLLPMKALSRVKRHSETFWSYGVDKVRLMEMAFPGNSAEFYIRKAKASLSDEIAQRYCNNDKSISNFFTQLKEFDVLVEQIKNPREALEILEATQNTKNEGKVKERVGKFCAIAGWNLLQQAT